MDHDSPIGYMLPKFVVQMVWATTGFEVDDLNRTVHLSLKLDAGESVFTACEKEFARLCRLNMTIVNGVKKWVKALDLEGDAEQHQIGDSAQCHWSEGAVSSSWQCPDCHSRNTHEYVHHQGR